MFSLYFSKFKQYRTIWIFSFDCINFQTEFGVFLSYSYIVFGSIDELFIADVRFSLFVSRCLIDKNVCVCVCQWWWRQPSKSKHMFNKQNNNNIVKLFIVVSIGHNFVGNNLSDEIWRIQQLTEKPFIGTN